MSGWHTLAGYLYWKPTGALSRLRAKKRQWYVYDESKSQLIYFKDSKSKEILGHIDIQDAAISLSEQEENQFTVWVDGKEHILEAETHDSMMIWVNGLQAKRDTQGLKRSIVLPTERRLSKESKLTRRHTIQRITYHKRPDEFPRVSEPTVQSYPQLITQPTTRNGGTGLVDPNFIQQSRRARMSLVVDSPWLQNSDKSTNSNSSGTNSSSLRQSITSCSGAGSSYLAESGCSPVHEEVDDERDVGLTKIVLSQSFTPGMRQADDSDSDGNQSEGDDVFDYNTLGETLKLNVSDDSLDVETPRPAHGNDVTELQLNSYIRSIKPDSASSDSVIEREIDPRVRLSILEKELLDSKSELANALNRENCLQEMLDKREATLTALDEKISQYEQLEMFLLEGEKESLRNHVALPSNDKNERNMKEAMSRTNAQLKALQSQCRVLRTQNKFLNEEVKKLAENKLVNQRVLDNQQRKMEDLEMDIERWKRDYIFLLQSNITVPTGDVMDGFELNLYGGDRHKIRLEELLEEARLKNPGLPTFEKLTSTEYHVDRYGFKHSHENESLLLHYICRQLNEHYSTQLSSYEEHQLKWQQFLERYKNHFVTATKELKSLCRAGVPVQNRSDLWQLLIHSQIKDFKMKLGPHYYNNLCSQLADSQTAGSHRKQIHLDLLRTLPTNVHFDHNHAPGIKKLQEVLQVFTIHNPDIGYCQGMNFIAGMSLLFLDKEDSFWCLVAFSESYFPAHYFNSNLIGAQADQMVLKDLIEEKLPQLYRHLSEIDIDISTITLNWFLAVFFDALPFETLIRVWDCFLLEGPKVLFRISLAILKIHERILLQQSDTISIWKHLKLAARLTFDVEGLLKVAFEDLEPFVKRKEIHQKQDKYMLALKEKEQSRRRYRRAYEIKEEELKKLDRLQMNRPIIECITALGNGRLWLCYGEQNSGSVCEIVCNEKVMYESMFEFDSRILSICALDPDMVFLGSLSRNLYAFNAHTKDKLWQTQLQDSVLDLCVWYSEDTKQHRLFAALANGHIAVIENVGPHLPTSNVFHLGIEISPVTSLLIVNQHLWCACGNSVQLLNTNTLDLKKQFRISSNPLDNILSMSLGGHGVWICVKGSSIIELWDQITLKCKMLFDIKENRCPANKRDDDSLYNPNRVTSLLPLRNTIWVGSGQGDLIVYEINEKKPSLGGFVFNRFDEMANKNDNKSDMITVGETSSATESSQINEDFNKKSNLCLDESIAESDTVNDDVIQADPPYNTQETAEAVYIEQQKIDYCVELGLLVKNKVAESPIRCLKEVQLNDNAVIISCSSRAEEDECILMWSRVNSENKIWTNVPIFRMNQDTKAVHWPAYMKHRMSLSYKENGNE